MNRIFRLGLALIALALLATACGTARPRVTTLAGSSEGYADGSGSTAQFSSPLDVAVDAQGNVYVADSANHRIRKIAPDGAASFIVTTLAGSTETGYVAGYADGPASQALFQGPRSLDVDGAGNVYVADTGNHRIRKIVVRGGQ